MHTEIEAKFLNININELRDKLRALGATQVQPERAMKRKNFDYPTRGAIRGWVRVRDEAGKITMTYKQLNDRSLHGTKEINLEVSDFDAACALLVAVGMVENSHQETKRESWLLDNAEVEIDTWPWLPTFAEIEAKSEDEFNAVRTKLGLHNASMLHGSVDGVYPLYYDVTEEDVLGWKQITFGPVPDWLASKQKSKPSEPTPLAELQ